MGVDRVLHSTDLDELADAVADLDAVPDRTGRVAAVVADWADEQAVANLLLHPAVIPPEQRTDALLRGLRGNGYLRLAATVGVGHLSAGDLTEGVRRELVDALLDVVASDAKEAGVRASAELGPLLRAEDVELLDDLAAHPVDAVRHNLTQAALAVTDPAAQQPVLLPYLPDYPTYLQRLHVPD